MNVMHGPIATKLLLRPAWSPYIGQQGSVVNPPAAGGPSLFSIDGPVFALATDVALVASSALLATGFGYHKSRYSSLFWGIAAIAGFKGLLDLSRIYK